MPGLTITGELSSSAAGSTWSAVRRHDDRALVVKIVMVSDLSGAQAQAAQLAARLRGIDNEHLVRQHDAIALADGGLALVLDQVTGGSLSHLLGARGKLAPGEVVTTIAPLFGALADLHSAGVVHGDLAPTTLWFSADGRPLISDLGVARLLGRQTRHGDGSPGFVAPELVGGAAPSPASDVYALAAIGWYCLTGALPGTAATRPSLATVRPEAPPRLVEVLSTCLSTNPAARLDAAAAAVEVFEAAAAEPVRLASMVDPAAEITRRIRAAAVAAPTLEPLSTRQRHRHSLAVAVVALVVASALAGGATWFLRLRPVAVQPVAVRSLALPSRTSSTVTGPSATATSTRVMDVVTSPESPRKDAAGLLQALVDARALAYVSRTPALLDLVYAPGATRAVVDRSNIATALKNGATYLGLAFVVRDVAFVDGTSHTARIRATIVTRAYETGQPGGRKVSHPQEIAGPSVFTVNLASDGWRILSLTSVNR